MHTRLLLLPVLAGVVGIVVAGCGASGTPRHQARSYIRSMHRDMNTVQASVESVVVGINLVAKDPSIADINEFAGLAQQAHDSIDAIRKEFATTDTSGKLGNAELELFSAANDLKNAMGAVVAYEGNPNAATLAHFTDQYQQARGEWNQGVTEVWRLARERKPLTICSSCSKMTKQVTEATSAPAASPTKANPPATAHVPTGSSYSGNAPTTEAGAATDQSSCGAQKLYTVVADTTSCPFAATVVAIAEAARKATGHFPATITTTSSVTHETYTLRCELDNAPELQCRTGTAEVTISTQ